MHKGQKNAQYAPHVAQYPGASLFTCMMCTRGMHDLHFRDISACTIRISAMYDMHRTHTRYAHRQRSPDGHTARGPAGGRPRICSWTHKDEPRPHATTLRGPGAAWRRPLPLHSSRARTARLPVKSHSRPTGGVERRHIRFWA